MIKKNVKVYAIILPTLGLLLPLHLMPRSSFIANWNIFISFVNVQWNLNFNFKLFQSKVILECRIPQFNQLLHAFPFLFLSSKRSKQTFFIPNFYIRSILCLFPDFCSSQFLNQYSNMTGSSTKSYLFSFLLFDITTNGFDSTSLASYF